MPVLDTSVVVPLFDADHEHHDRARRLVAEAGTLHVSGGVLAEATTTLRRLGKDAGLDGDRLARDALERLEALRGFRPAREHDAAAVSRLYRGTTGLSYVDAWGVVLAFALGDELLSFDERQLAVWKRERKRS